VREETPSVWGYICCPHLQLTLQMADAASVSGALLVGAVQCRQSPIQLARSAPVVSCWVQPQSTSMPAGRGILGAAAIPAALDAEPSRREQVGSISLLTTRSGSLCVFAMSCPLKLAHASDACRCTRFSAKHSASTKVLAFRTSDLGLFRIKPTIQLPSAVHGAQAGGSESRPDSGLGQCSPSRIRTVSLRPTASRSGCRSPMPIATGNRPGGAGALGSG
jgi:hypothetical protein